MFIQRRFYNINRGNNTENDKYFDTLLGVRYKHRMPLDCRKINF